MIRYLYRVFPSSSIPHVQLSSSFCLDLFLLWLCSDKLRAALSLQDGECPIFINRMREYGYPPGWKLFREETLKMFDSTGEGVLVNEWFYSDSMMQYWF